MLRYVHSRKVYGLEGNFFSFGICPVGDGSRERDGRGIDGFLLTIVLAAETVSGVVFLTEVQLVGVLLGCRPVGSQREIDSGSLRGCFSSGSP